MGTRTMCCDRMGHRNTALLIGSNRRVVPPHSIRSLHDRKPASQKRAGAHIILRLWECICHPASQSEDQHPLQMLGILPLSSLSCSLTAARVAEGRDLVASRVGLILTARCAGNVR